MTKGPNLPHEPLALEQLRAELETSRKMSADLIEQLAEVKSAVDGTFDDNRRLAIALEEERKKIAQMRVEMDELERRSSTMASLYAAAYRLHGAFRRDEVYQAIQEIVANIVGSEQLAIFRLHRGKLSLVSSLGSVPAGLDEVEIGTGTIGEVAATGKTWIAEAPRHAEPGGDPPLSACIPLKLDHHVIGAIAIFGLLPQKARFEEADYEIFDLLATRAGSALECACAMSTSAPTLVPKR
jgi:hypothetical protein